MGNLNKILKNTIVKNGIWMYLLQFFNMVIPLITLPYVTRILGTNSYGVFSSAFNIVGYLQVIVEYGFGMSASREVALNNNQKNLNRIFSSVLITRIILALGCLNSLLVFIFSYKMSWIQISSYLLLSISLLGIVFQVDWLFQGMQDMKFISLTNIIARTVTTILIFIFVNKASDVILYCMLYASSPLISNLIGITIVKKKYQIKLIKISISEILYEFKSGWYIFTTQFTSRVFGSIGVTFLVFWDTSKVVGAFSAIQKIPNVVLMLWLPISQIIYPVVSKKMNKNILDGLDFVLKLRRRFLIFISISVIILIAFSKYIVLVSFGYSYVSYYLWLIPLLLWSIISIDNGFLGVQILLGSGHDKEYSFCFFISVIITVISSAILVFYFGGLGASIAPLISEGILDLLLLREVKKLKMGKANG